LLPGDGGDYLAKVLAVSEGGQADETIFLIRRSHPETNQCSIRP